MRACVCVRVCARARGHQQRRCAHLTVRRGEEDVQRGRRLAALLADERERAVRRHEVEIVLRRRAHGLDDEPQLVHVLVAGEQRLAQQDLAEDAADGPHVHGLRVLLRTEQTNRSDTART
jgi:hypothetical protein